MRLHFGRACGALCSGLLAVSLLFGLTTSADSKSKPKKPEKKQKASHSPTPSPTPSPTSSAPPSQVVGESKPQFDPKLWSGMQWREVGPFRGGRAIAIEGVPDEPNTYYFGGVAGGVW